MNITIQTRLWGCGILLGCCLVTAIFNSLVTTTFVNLITFVLVTIVLLIELARVHGGLYRENDASNASIVMLGCALVAGASLVGGMMSTDLMDGFTMYVDIHGQQYKATHRHLEHTGVAFFIIILSYFSWLFSMLVFLFCARKTRSKESGAVKSIEQKAPEP